jgi:curved DNA-binding protein CbpA
MAQQPFVDFYDVLQLSPTATGEMIDHVYRMLAKRYHPDNQVTGDEAKFAELRRAHEVLSDSTTRASYDVAYDENKTLTWKIFRQEPAGDNRAEDRRLFHAILSLLYIARRRDPANGGLGGVMLEKMLACPQEHLEFPLWYLRQRGWITRLDSGYIAITADGIDKLGSDDLSLPANRLLTESSVARSADAPEATPGGLTEGAASTFSEETAAQSAGASN